LIWVNFLFKLIHVKTVAVKIFKDKIWFNPELGLSLAQTNLPFKFFKFSQRPIFWLLEMKSFDKESSQLNVNVLDFKAPYNESWQEQKPKAEISKLHFIHLDWGAFCACLSYYQSDAKDMMPYDPSLDNNAIGVVSKFHEMSITVPIKQLKIGHGKVSFGKKFKWSEQEEILEIQQANMIPDYEYIKPYFSKVLKKSTIEVNVSLKITDKVVEILECSSEDLASIDSDAIYVVKSYKIDNWKRIAKESASDNLLFDSSQVNNELQDFGNVDEFEREILFHVLEDENIRNKAQLEYLSNILLDTQRLMLSVEPQFGFVFVVQGSDMVHCVWELVNSHGTYVWSFAAKEFGAQQLKLLETEFALLAQNGRSHYRNNFRNSSSLFFNVVQHQRSDDPIVDHFGKWRVALEKLFV